MGLQQFPNKSSDDLTRGSDDLENSESMLEGRALSYAFSLRGGVSTAGSRQKFFAERLENLNCSKENFCETMSSLPADSFAPLLGDAEMASQLQALDSQGTIEAPFEKMSRHGRGQLAERPPVVWVLGPPGSGKGTICSLASQRFNL